MKILEEQEAQMNEMTKSSQLSVSLARKDEQLAALNEKIAKNEETRHAAESSLNDSIEEVRVRERGAKRQAEMEHLRVISAQRRCFRLRF